MAAVSLRRELARAIQWSGDIAFPAAVHRLRDRIRESLVVTDGRYPAPNERLIEQVGSASITRVATTDAEGSYSLADVPSGTRLALVVARRLQPCAAVATVVGNVVLDIDVLKSGFDRSPHISPTLSGLVFYTVDGARRLYRDGAAISFFSSSVAGGHLSLARVITDDEGRFELCRLRSGPATL